MRIRITQIKIGNLDGLHEAIKGFSKSLNREWAITRIGNEVYLKSQ